LSASGFGPTARSQGCPIDVALHRLTIPASIVSSVNRSGTVFAAFATRIVVDSNSTGRKNPKLIAAALIAMTERR
jgi:hypothetical protein